jgi:hypothetical protein
MVKNKAFKSVCAWQGLLTEYQSRLIWLGPSLTQALVLPFLDILPLLA